MKILGQSEAKNFKMKIQYFQFQGLKSIIKFETFGQIFKFFLAQPISLLKTFAVWKFWANRRQKISKLISNFQIEKKIKFFITKVVLTPFYVVNFFQSWRYIHVRYNEYQSFLSLKKKNVEKSTTFWTFI